MSPLGPAPGRRILRITVSSPAGELEALFRPAAEARGGALVCHPHPLYGGTMHDRVVVAAERGFVGAGLSTLRFNFRGVGGSEGSFDEGRGEKEDVRAALRVLAARVPELPLVAAGYSFGCAVCLPVAACDERVAALFGVGVPFTLVGPPDLSSCPRPKVFVQGERDELGPLEALRDWARSLPGATEIVAVRDADHFFRGDLAGSVREAAERLGRRVVEKASPSPER